MARSLSGRQDRLEIPLSKSGSVTTFDNIEELAPGPADTPILWRPRITNYPATDLILTVGTKVFFLQCTVANTHLVALRTDSGPPGLLQQAGILAKRGFDTGRAELRPRHRGPHRGGVHHRRSYRWRWEVWRSVRPRPKARAAVGGGLHPAVLI